MKHSATKIFILALFFGLAMILGCGEGEKPPEKAIQEKQEEAKEEIKEIQKEAKEEVKEETGDAVDSVTEFTIEQKEEYSAKINEQLLDMEKKIQELKDQAQTMEGDARVSIDQQLAELSAMHENASNELSNLKNHGMETWSEARQILDNAMDQMEQAYQYAKSKVE